MGRAHLRRHLRHLHDVDAGHVVQVYALRHASPGALVTPPVSARLPGFTVALFSTLQPLFTGILGLIGITSASLNTLLLLPLLTSLAVLDEGMSLQAGLGGAAIVIGKCQLCDRSQLQIVMLAPLTLLISGLAICCHKINPPPPLLNSQVDHNMQPLLGSRVA
jgi:hypothetical protein